MKTYTDPNFTPEVLESFQGYSLQAFASGRIKLSFHRTQAQRDEYYAERPKRDAEAYHRQRRRSAEALPNHFGLVDTLRTDRVWGAILRVHLKGDNNKTADNAHVLLSWSKNVCLVVLEQMVHAWELPSEAMISLCDGQGSRQGAASIFNEYMPSYEHDWQAADFNLTHYAKGYRPLETGTHFAAPKADDDLNY